VFAFVALVLLGHFGTTLKKALLGALVKL